MFRLVQNTPQAWKGHCRFALARLDWYHAGTLIFEIAELAWLNKWFNTSPLLLIFYLYSVLYRELLLVVLIGVIELGSVYSWGDFWPGSIPMRACLHCKHVRLLPWFFNLSQAWTLVSPNPDFAIVKAVQLVRVFCYTWRAQIYIVRVHWTAFLHLLLTAVTATVSY